MKLKLRYGFLLLTLIVVACTDFAKIDDVEYRSSDPEFAVPIVHTSLTLEDLFNQRDIEDTELIIKPDSSLSLFYSGDVLMQGAKDIFPPIFGFIPVAVVKEVDTIALPVQRLDLIQANLTGDSLIVAARSNLTEDVFVHVEIPSFTRNGEVVSFDLELKYDGELPTEAIGITTMGGMNFSFIDNSMIVHYDARNANGDKVNLDLLQLYWDEMTFSYVEGYFSKNEVNIPGDFINIEVYDKWITGDLYFEDPTVDVVVDNSFGFPVRAKVNQLRFIGNQGQIVDLTSPQNDSINFSYPTLTEVGEVKNNLITYDGDNSNIEDIINIQPVRLEYDIDAIGNPDEDSTIIGFFTDSSFIRINVSVELPVHGWANNFSARDTFDFDVDNIEDIEQIEFKMIFDNGMAMELSTQVYLLDENKVLLDSMFKSDDLTIAAADIDGAGRAVGQNETVRFEKFEEDRLDNLMKAKFGVLQGSFLTKDAPNQSVFVDANDAIGFRMGAKVKLK